VTLAALRGQGIEERESAVVGARAVDTGGLAVVDGTL
jgi:hypothetical protein